MSKEDKFWTTEHFDKTLKEHQKKDKIEKQLEEILKLLNELKGGKEKWLMEQ